MQALYILASFRNCRYEFLFTNRDLKSTRHYTSVIGVYRYIFYSIKNFYHLSFIIISYSLNITFKKFIKLNLI